MPPPAPAPPALVPRRAQKAAVPATTTTLCAEEPGDDGQQRFAHGGVPSRPVAEPRSVESLGWGARSLQRLAGRAPCTGFKRRPEVGRLPTLPESSRAARARLQRLASARARRRGAAPDHPGRQEGRRRRAVGAAAAHATVMVHAAAGQDVVQLDREGAALRTRFGPFPATPEALNKWPHATRS